jgi:HSP20 family protein
MRCAFCQNWEISQLPKGRLPSRTPGNPEIPEPICPPPEAAAQRIIGEHAYREMSSGAFSRTVGLPAAVDTKQTRVWLKSGILEMTMPKTEAEKRHKIPIEEG